MDANLQGFPGQLHASHFAGFYNGEVGSLVQFNSNNGAGLANTIEFTGLPSLPHLGPEFALQNDEGLRLISEEEQATTSSVPQIHGGPTPIPISKDQDSHFFAYRPNFSSNPGRSLEKHGSEGQIRFIEGESGEYDCGESASFSRVSHFSPVPNTYEQTQQESKIKATSTSRNRRKKNSFEKLSPPKHVKKSAWELKKMVEKQEITQAEQEMIQDSRRMQLQRIDGAVKTHRRRVRELLFLLLLADMLKRDPEAHHETGPYVEFFRQEQALHDQVSSSKQRVDGIPTNQKEEKQLRDEILELKQKIQDELTIKALWDPNEVL